MPLCKYGVLKGKVVGIKDEKRERRDRVRPHVKIKIQCENDDTDYEIAVNARSKLKPHEVAVIFFKEEGKKIWYEFSDNMQVIFEDFKVVYQV